MARNLEILDYRGYLLLLALGGLVPFGAFNMLALAILSMRLGVVHFNSSIKLDTKWLSFYFIFCSFFLVVIYHLMLGDFRFVWVVRYILFLLSIYFIVRNPIKVSVCNLNFVLIIILLYIFFDIYQLVSRQALFLNGQYRTYGMSLGRIVFSCFMMLICFVLILLYEKNKKLITRSQFIYINILKSLCFIHIYLSGSRSFLLAILCLAFLRRWSLSRNVSKFMILVSVVLVFFLLQEMNARFATIFDTSFGSNYTRLLFLENGFDLWKEYIFFGAGPGRSIDYLSSVMNENMPALHFDVLLIASELGLLGLGIFCFIFFFLKASRSLIVISCFLLLSLQNSLYYTSYILFIILTVEGVNVREHV